VVENENSVPSGSSVVNQNLPYHFGIGDSPIYKIRDRNKINGILINHGLRCMRIQENMRIVLAPYPWLLPRFRPDGAFLPKTSKNKRNA
jgi:hypothetical protein